MWTFTTVSISLKVNIANILINNHIFRVSALLFCHNVNKATDQESYDMSIEIEQTILKLLTGHIDYECESWFNSQNVGSESY